MFIAYNFKPRNRRTKSIREVLNFAIGFKRTIVGWVNLRLVGCADQTVINLSPQEFSSLFPEASANAVSGVVYLSISRAEELGFTFSRELEEVTIA